MSVEHQKEYTAAYKRATAQETKARQSADKAARSRAEAVAALHFTGLSYGRIASLLGLSRSRIQQLVEKGNALEAGDG